MLEAHPVRAAAAEHVIDVDVQPAEYLPETPTQTPSKKRGSALFGRHSSCIGIPIPASASVIKEEDLVAVAELVLVDPPTDGVVDQALVTELFVLQVDGVLAWLRYSTEDAPLGQYAGGIDGEGESISALAKLIKRGWMALRMAPSAGRVLVYLTPKPFSLAADLPDAYPRQASTAFMELREVMSWLRPELSPMTDAEHRDFAPEELYDAVRPTGMEPQLTCDFPALLPTLRPYQRRAVAWMVNREKAIEGVQHDDEQPHPLWEPVEDLRGTKSFYYCPYSGQVSWTRYPAPPPISGGILADEPGLGKTVEVLTLVLANQHEVSRTMQARKAHRKRLKEVTWQRLVATRRERVDCVCGADIEEELGKYRVQCEVCYAWQHAYCVEYDLRLSDPELIRIAGRDFVYVCSTCRCLCAGTVVEEDCGSTLIVCPASILQQWQEEIKKHVQAGELRVFTYEGVRAVRAKAQALSAYHLATADIVLTTYETLRADVHHDTEGDTGCVRITRQAKRFKIVPTPLTRLHWWRVCLDEAQMVESSTAQATEMALRLKAKHRWCITGTPIERGLEDLYGLLRFLNARPYSEHIWWSRVLQTPYEAGSSSALARLHSFLHEVMWRTAKIYITSELQLPVQETLISKLEFSSVEKYFYARQHKLCAETLRLFLSRNAQREAAGIQLDAARRHKEMAKVLNTLLHLRQACCHPQIGSSGVRGPSMQRVPITMDEVLETLILKAKVECEDWQRQQIKALNGLAGLMLLENRPELAVTAYREALSTAEENSSDFSADPLQRLHTLHNLAEVQARPGLSVAPTLRDSQLATQAAEIRDNYLAEHIVKAAAVQQDYKKQHELVESRSAELSRTRIQIGQRGGQGGVWWLHALQLIERNMNIKEFIAKVQEHLSTKDIDYQNRNAANFAHRFRDIIGLQLLVQNELDAIATRRAAVLAKLPEVTHAATVAGMHRAAHCRKCRPSEMTGPDCQFCELEESLSSYELRLFTFRATSAAMHAVVTIDDAERARQRAFQTHRSLMALSGASRDMRNTAAEGLQAAGSRAGQSVDASQVATSLDPSQTEVVLKYLLRAGKQAIANDPEVASAGAIHLAMLEAMRLEFLKLRQLVGAQRDVMYAHDELGMATLRLSLRHPVEQVKEYEKIFKILMEEVPVLNASFSAEKMVAAAELERKKGELRYLKNQQLARAKLNKSSEAAAEDVCPICQELIGNDLAILPCGHTLCTKCTMALQDRIPRSTPRQLQLITCPTCRRRANVSEVTAPIPAAADSRAKAGEAAITVHDASKFSTKIEAVVRRILWIGKEDETAKVLVFSQWQEVLNHVEVALQANFVMYARVKAGGQGKFAATVNKFRHDPTLRALLLPIKQGGHGLNIIEAQHVILVDPLLNPAMEIQAHMSQSTYLTSNKSFRARRQMCQVNYAVNRVHRVGQTRQTYVHRFLMKGTIEENVYAMSQRRAAAASMLNLKVTDDAQTLSLTDLDELFFGQQAEQEARATEMPTSDSVPPLSELSPTEAADATRTNLTANQPSIEAVQPTSATAPTAVQLC
eukprot:jgi/Chlat1/7629/Chrsp64S07159